MRHGLMLAALGVLAFSLSLPATRMAAPELGAVNVGLGRAVIASVLAFGYLLVKRAPFPTLRQTGSLVFVGVTLVLAFPLLTAYAMQTVPSSHGSVVHAVVPIITAVLGCMRTGERPSSTFWIASIVGTLAAIAGALTRVHAGFGEGDLVLLVSVFVVAAGYVECGKLSTELAGPSVISWALVLTAPLSIAAVAYETATHGVPQASATAWLGLAYVGVFSMFLGFFAWNRGLAEAGITRASQVQLVQTLLGLGWSALLLGEQVTTAMWASSIAVLVCVRIATRARR